MEETISQERSAMRVKRGCLEGRRKAGDAREAGRSCQPEVEREMKSCKKWRGSKTGQKRKQIPREETSVDTGSQNMLKLWAHTEDSHAEAKIQHNMKLKKAETALACLVLGEKSSPSLGMVHSTCMYKSTGYTPTKGPVFLWISQRLIRSSWAFSGASITEPEVWPKVHPVVKGVGGGGGNWFQYIAS